MMRVDESASVFIHREPVDFRKQINGLALIVESELGLDPFNAGVFAFTNRARDRAKVLYWHCNGFCLWQKRLEKQRFVWPVVTDEAVVSITGDQLNWLLDGFDIFRFPPHERLIYRAVG